MFKDMNMRFQIINKLLTKIDALSHGKTKVPTHVSWTRKNKQREDKNPTLKRVAHYSLLTLSVEEKSPPMMVMVAAALRGREESVFALRKFWNVSENEKEWVRGKVEAATIKGFRGVKVMFSLENNQHLNLNSRVILYDQIF